MTLNDFLEFLSFLYEALDEFVLYITMPAAMEDEDE